MKISRQFYEQDAGKVQTKNSQNLDVYSHFHKRFRSCFFTSRTFKKHCVTFFNEKAECKILIKLTPGLYDTY